MVNINENTIIKRSAGDQIIRGLKPAEVVLVYGPRRCGKTTLLRQIAEQLKGKEKILWLEGELDSTKRQLVGGSIERLKALVGDYSLLIVDEAQAVPEIGQALKLLVDHLPDLKIIASGSASFELAQKIGEPLVGRQRIIKMYPLWAGELRDYFGVIAFDEMLDNILIFGSYPALQGLSGDAQRKEYLENLVSSYLYRDILTLDSVRNAKKIQGLLQLLAWQIGNEVSIKELATQLEMGTQTVARYLDLLEKSFVIKNITGFSRNLRKEITRSSRYYFYDNGVRNALIANFNPPDDKIRNDTGALWENWLVMERLKKQAYAPISANNYFWRTYDQKEIDWVEERDGKLWGYEFSVKPKNIRPNVSKEFLSTYPGSVLSSVDRGNFEDFII